MFNTRLYYLICECLTDKVVVRRTKAGKEDNLYAFIPARMENENGRTVKTVWFFKDGEYIACLDDESRLKNKVAGLEQQYNADPSALNESLLLEAYNEIID